MRLTNALSAARALDLESRAVAVMENPPDTFTDVVIILTDVDVLAECVPRWFATPGMGSERLAEFYNHPRKLDVDTEALERARQHRQAAMDSSLRWRIYGWLLDQKWRIESAVEAWRSTRA